MNSDTNIYNKLGLLLDQTQPKIKIKTNGSNLVFKNIFAKLEKVNCFTQKYGLTLTFRSSFHRDDPLYLHRLIEQEFSKYNDEFSYICFPEFTKKNNNLHYHCVIWNCYELGIITFCKRWQRKFGIYKLENPLRHYYCHTHIDNICRVKYQMLNPKPESRCWVHYILKDYGNGLWSITNY